MLRRMKKRINGQYIWLYEGVSKVTEFPSFRKLPFIHIFKSLQIGIFKGVIRKKKIK